MAPRRKTAKKEQSNEPVGPDITRYTLSDGGHGSLRPTNQFYEGLQSSEANYNEEPFRNSLAVSIPESHELHSQIGTPVQQYHPYQPGQSLEPIITGETLQLSQEVPHPYASSNGGSFNDDKTQYSYYPEQDYVPPSAQSYASELPAGSEYDAFRYDAEAYASGNYTRASFQPPRSRSPTPAVDDEDYYVVGDQSIHYVGASPNKYKDIEKLYVSSFGPSHTTVYDPEPQTPTSLQSTLPDSFVETRHFGPAPVGRAIRRRKTKRRVKLTNGHYVLNHDIPDKLFLPRRKEPETMRMRYTAVTCDPDDFEKEGFCLRQNEYNRTTELFIVITMYNEDEVLFCRTLYGVMRNISYLCSRKNSQTWGPNAWEKVVVCIVADGRRKIHPRVLDCLTLLGVYQDGIMKSSIKTKVNGQEQTVPVTAHLFEYTTTFALDPNLHFKYPDEGTVPTQIILCLKEKNQKKINSHRWFFNAFAPLLQPNVCILLDVGTRPGTDSLYRLWKAFDLNSSIGGACGEISVYKGKNWSLLLNPLVAAQNFEYKISGILDKTTESVFGYISVLPGAFSAYRYIALQNDEHGNGPLASYFKGEVLHGRETDIFTSNMYLAEDRILCFELVAKPHSNWVLKYVKGAFGETDVPESLPEFISQRRRWLNGSFFAATFAIAHIGQILRSGHSLPRKVTLMLQMTFNVVNLISSWFSLGNFYLFFIILTSSLEDPSLGLKGITYFNFVAQSAMAGIIIACFLFSMGNKPKASTWKYTSAVVILALLTIYLIAASIICAVQAAKQGGPANSVMVFSVVITYGVYLFSSILAVDVWHMVTSFIPYLLLSPTYINVLNIYAFSNLDDISWGTKQDTLPEVDLGSVVQVNHSEVDVEMNDAAGARQIYEEALYNIKTRKPAHPPKGPPTDAEKEQAAKDYYANVRTNVLLAWVFSNGLLLLGILKGAKPDTTFTDDPASRTKAYLTFILAFSAIANLTRLGGSFVYMCVRFLFG